MKATLKIVQADDDSLLAEEVEAGEYIVSGLDRARVSFVRETTRKTVRSRWTIVPHDSRFVPRSTDDDFEVLSTVMNRRMSSRVDFLELIDLTNVLDRMATTIDQTPSIAEAAAREDEPEEVVESVFRVMYSQA